MSSFSRAGGNIPRFPLVFLPVFLAAGLAIHPAPFSGLGAEESAAETAAEPGAGKPAAGESAAGEADSIRLTTIHYGTETEIAALIQSLHNEQSDSLDTELIDLAQNTRNRNILRGVFVFFGDRGKTGLEDRAIRAIVERDEETNETVIAAVDYLGRVQAGSAAESLQKLILTKERRFMVSAIRALGRAAGTEPDLADGAAEFLTQYYTTEDPPDEYRREIISAIGETKSALGIPFLTNLVTNPEERAVLRMTALESLSKIGDDRGLGAIIFAVSDEDPNVRSGAIAALGPFQGEPVDKAILEAFRDSYYRTRIAAAQASRIRKLEAAIPYLKFRSERDDVPQVKDEAIRALGAIGTPETLGILESLFRERKNPDPVRIRSAEMLMASDAEGHIENVIAEMDDAKFRNQTPLYQGLLKIAGGARSGKLEALSRRLLGSADLTEKSYGLDLAANNTFRGLAEDVRGLTENRNAGLARKARNVLEKLEE
jgi:HEAT repeat protein